MTYWTILLAVEATAETAKEGGLFDLDATLPIMALQFLVLVVLLNGVFYKPLGKAIDDREELVRTNILSAQERLGKAQSLAKQYEHDLGETRRKAGDIVAQAQSEAQKIAAAKIAEAQQEAQVQREQAQKEIDQQKQAAFNSLESEVAVLSHQILLKVLGTELVK